jgi:hypothetical protein
MIDEDLNHAEDLQEDLDNLRELEGDIDSPELHLRLSILETLAGKINGEPGGDIAYDEVQVFKREDFQVYYLHLLEICYDLSSCDICRSSIIDYIDWDMVWEKESKGLYIFEYAGVTYFCPEAA